jgi:hypothetical protein
MKYCYALLLIVVSTATFADESKVEITSFVYAGSRTRAAELCGRVTGTQSQSQLVKLVVDPKSKTPGIYNVVVGTEGAFCVTVVTYQGEAEATLRTGTRGSLPALATVSRTSDERF